MTKIALRKVAMVACATALMQLPLAAAAAPVDLGRFVYEVRKGYTDTVRVNIRDSSDTPQGGVEVRQIELQDLKDPGRTHLIAVQDGAISEADARGAVDWLIAAFPADRGYETLEAIGELEADADPADPNVVNTDLAARELVKVPIGNNANGLFTASGEQEGVLQGGDQPSVGQVHNTLEGVSAARAVKKSSDNKSVAKIATADMAETEALADTEVNELLAELGTELPSRSGNPPLVSATDPVIPQLRQGLTHDVLMRVTAEIDDRVAERRGQIKGEESGLLVHDVVDAFKAAGVDDVDVRYTTEESNLTGKDEGNLLITSGAQIIADGVTAAKGRDNSWYLGGEAVYSLQVQIGAKAWAALEPAIDQRGVRGDPPARVEDVDAAVSTIERDMGEEPGEPVKGKPGKGESGGSDGEGGSGDLVGEKK